MHVVLASAAYDVRRPRLNLQRFRIAAQAVLPSSASLSGGRIALRAVGIAAQGVGFAVAVWLLLAGPGFLPAEDGSDAAATGRSVAQASR